MEKIKKKRKKVANKTRGKNVKQNSARSSESVKSA